MGCSSSREAGGGLVSPAAAPAERRQGLRSRSLGMCRGAHAYTALPFEEPLKGARDPATAEEALPGDDAATEEKRRHEAPIISAAVMASIEDAASSSTARWSAEPAASSLPPEQLPALDLDPAVLPGFRELVQVPSPSENSAPQKACDDDILEVTDSVRARVVDGFHGKLEKKKAAVATEEATDAVDGDDVTAPRCRLPRAGKPVVLYLTSLRGVRRTFEDCRAVRAILRCYRVRLDERDVSMHAAFRSELRDLLGAGFEGPALPRVFVDGRHDLGSAEGVRALHEAGELARALAACECEASAEPTTGRLGHACSCAACGEARFVPCGTCHGSCKVFVDDERCRLAAFFRQCPDCNENGLIRCPVCCY
ncbi:Uncharacterized protein Zm00014a_023778 [Zea mays]|uniref:Glutaredoxin domain-containing protein n=1 Tax=Zea mays TaxID=4577 RepID=A0A3L6GB46_MAIZE|nr:Uncharacterized protein Zm00014a_023778 [Zea mays]